MDQRFDDVNKRFDDVSKRFDDVSKRFDDVNKRLLLILSGMGISLATILAVLGWIISRLP